MACGDTRNHNLMGFDFLVRSNMVWKLIFISPIATYGVPFSIVALRSTSWWRQDFGQLRGTAWSQRSPQFSQQRCHDVKRVRIHAELIFSIPLFSLNQRETIAGRLCDAVSSIMAVPPTKGESLRRVCAAHSDPILAAVVALC